ncbi:hypothetical protein ACFPRL_34835 [Pseudoclavibacter helvolus]
MRHWTWASNGSASWALPRKPSSSPIRRRRRSTSLVPCVRLGAATDSSCSTAQTMGRSRPRSTRHGSRPTRTAT